MADYKSSGTDTVVKIVLVFFISLLSFLIGTFVGKSFFENQHRQAAMEPKGVIEQKVEASAHEAGTPKEATEKHESGTNQEAGSVGANHEPEALSDDQVAALEAEMGTEEELASTATPKHDDPGAAPKLSKVLEKTVANQGVGKFTIQIASYPTQEEAEKKVSELKALKFESFATEATIKGHQWYRVNVGMFATIKEAQDHKTLLADRAKISTAIVQKLRK